MKGAGRDSPQAAAWGRTSAKLSRLAPAFCATALTATNMHVALMCRDGCSTFLQPTFRVDFGIRLDNKGEALFIRRVGTPE